MLAKIYDDRGRLLNKIEGIFKDNQIHYFVGGFSIFGKQFFGKPATLGCSYADVLQDAKRKIATYTYDGKEMHQVSWKEKPNSDATANDVLQNAKMADLTMDNALAKPKDFSQLATWAAIVILLLIAFILNTATSNLASTSQNYVTPLNHSLQLTNKIALACFNSINNLNTTVAALSAKV